jgi:outer membrane murein-binding lipoprotein Lpp
MDKFSFETLLLNLKTESGSNDLSKNQDIIELAQIVGVKEINDKDALYDGVIKFISNQKKEIEKHIRCFLGGNRYIADSEDNIILLYLLYKNSLYKDKVSRCIKELGDEDSNELLKVGKLLANLFRRYHKDYYSSILSREKILGNPIEEKINTINEPIISNMVERNKNNLGAERSKNDLREKILLVLLIYALLGFTIYQEIRIQQLEKDKSDLKNKISALENKIQQLEQKINKPTQQNNESEKQSDNQQTGSSKKSKSSKKSEKEQ